ALISRISSVDDRPSIHVLDREEAKLKALSQQYGVQTHTKPGEWIKNLNCVVLAVKPQDLPQAITEIKPFLGTGLILSIAAGVQTKDLIKMTGKNRICRVMPNTPVKTGLGVDGIFLTEAAKEDRPMVETILAPTGLLVWCDKEAMIESITCISGSGPAYVFLFLEALEKAGLNYGFSPEIARQLAIYTVLGSAKLAQGSPHSFTELSKAVQSKGGTTIEAVKVMEENGFQQTMLEAMKACRKRAIELGDEFSRKL
ncbi:MAG: pyrroline-5-carboxylate reductase, partial [Burkholderiales bacterium]|nr:pyrroline-5-carboxylate reductase [Burkholderiales bacterium]